MAQAGSKVSNHVAEMLAAPTGLAAKIAGLSQAEAVRLPVFDVQRISTQNVSNELVERSRETKYPAIHVYCEKLINNLHEKFRTFSGKAQMAIEVRLSQDRLEGLDYQLALFADAVTQVLDQARGDWGHGMFFTGGYEVAFGAVKHGGKNFIQTAKVNFEVQISLN